MQTHHPSKRGSMEEEDRLSSLPDDVLHSILRLLPLKHAVRTSALSRRWAPQWLRALVSSRVLDFTDRDFARGQPSARAAATVRRCLELHAEHGAPLDVFRVALRSPPAMWSDGAFGRDVVGWIASAVARGATEVEVYLTPAPTPTPTHRLRRRRRRRRHVPDGSAAFVELPGDLFVARNSLARLALGGFSLRTVPAAPTGLAGLRSLCLSHVNLAGDEVSHVVSSCRALEHLRLSSSGSWPSDPDRYRFRDRYLAASVSIRIASETLRVLEIVACKAVRQVRVTAPTLESIAFHDNEFFWRYEYDMAVDDDFDDRIFVFDGDMPALRDVYLSRILYDPDTNTTNYDSSLSYLEHVPVWTISCNRYDNLPLPFETPNNIQELQVLIVSEDHHSDDPDLAVFLQQSELPFLDRLFIRYPGHVTDECDADAAAALAGEVVDDSGLEIHDDEFVLGSLSFIKLVNFRGTRLELQLLALLLKGAPALEHLVLVTVGEEEGAPGPGDEHLEVIQRRVSAMHKASPHAHLTVCRPCQDRSQNPLRTRFYEEE